MNLFFSFIVMLVLNSLFLLLFSVNFRIRHRSSIVYQKRENKNRFLCSNLWNVEMNARLIVGLQKERNENLRWLFFPQTFRLKQTLFSLFPFCFSSDRNLHFHAHSSKVFSQRFSTCLSFLLSCVAKK